MRHYLALKRFHFLLSVGCIFMGIAYSVQTESYVTVDVLLLFVKSPKARKVCRVLSLIASLFNIMYIVLLRA